MLKRTALLSAGLSAAIAVPALAAHPIGGAHYVGKTAAGGRVSVRVSDDGKTIPVNGFAAHLKSTCSNGERVNGGLVSFKIKIRSGGGFVQERSGGLRSERGGDNDAGSYRFRITGKFGPRRVLKGTIESKTRQNNGIVCRTGKVSYTARVVED